MHSTISLPRPLSAALVVALLAVAGCSPEAGRLLLHTDQPEVSVQQFTNQNWNLAVNEAKGNRQQYIGVAVTLKGLAARGADTSLTAPFQLFADPKPRRQQTLVLAPSGATVASGQYVQVTGTLERYSPAAAPDGTSMQVPVVRARILQRIPRTEMFPALKTVQLGTTRAEAGLAITLDRLELAKEETRVYVSLKNDTSTSAYLSTSEATLAQGGVSQVPDNVSGEEVETPKSNVEANGQTSGVLIFSPLQIDASATFTWPQPGGEDIDPRMASRVWEIPAAR